MHVVGDRRRAAQPVSRCRCVQSMQSVQSMQLASMTMVGIGQGGEQVRRPGLGGRELCQLSGVCLGDKKGTTSSSGP